MKNKLSLIAILFIMCAACVSCVDNLIPIKGNGKLVTSERNVSGFQKIDVSGDADVRFHKSTEYRAVITIDSNLEEHVEIVVKNDELKIKTKRGRNLRHTKFQVDVYCPTVTGVDMSGSGSFESEDKVISSMFRLDISGSGKVNVAVECENFFADISGSGKITATGNSNSTDIDISGSGKFHGKEFTTHNAEITVSGSGDINIDVINTLKAKISGSGNINYSGNPAIDSKVSGSGKIKKE
ncbi:MAG: DUF2807 domain-containing protein [Bacteroidales bacterium]|jgi:hypothetical protein|nr:DUF2807 domain-containing protein [Bacteroidales bacterium]